ncbi:MAG: hypothetical protein O6924_12390 [Alphaproteobacteria bacterium]|nr:hypothetical protein [Alphaproteobacteria bacterium]
MNAVLPLRRVRDGGVWRHVGGVSDGVVRRIGLRAIRFHLDRAAASGDCEALASIREANALRQQLGLSWNQVVVMDVVGTEASP